MKWFKNSYKKLLSITLIGSIPLILLAQQTPSEKIIIHNSFTGDLEPYERLVILSEIQGTIEKADFEEGQFVKEGDILVHIETKRLALQEQLAQANYELANSEFETEKLLFDRHVSTASKLDTTRTTKNVKKINLELAQLDLDKSKVAAPFNGVIKSKRIRKSEFVRTGQALLELIDLSKILVAINIPENEIRYVKLGLEVQVRVGPLPGQVFKGKIKTIGMEAEKETHTFPAEVLIENPGNKLLPGMSATVEMSIL